MTRAPRSASWRVANGAATACSTATTVMPCRGCMVCGSAPAKAVEPVKKASTAESAETAKKRQRILGVLPPPLGVVFPELRRGSPQRLRRERRLRYSAALWHTRCSRALVRPRQTEHVLGHVSGDQVCRNGRNL